MKITNVAAHEIFDSRGYPTIECELTLENGQSVRASVPSGLSRGTYEAAELRDDNTRLMGLGVHKAIEKLEMDIAPLIINHEPNVVEMDLKMLELDGTQNKSNLGANTLLAASTAITKAQAISSTIKPYELIAQLCGFDQISLPYPQCNIINGGMHANNNLQIQEIMIVPIGFPTFREAFEAILEINYKLKTILHKQGKKTLVGDEGGFASNFDDETEALDLLMQAIEEGKTTDEKNFVIALDMATSHFYNPQTKTYNWHNRTVTSHDMIKLYDKLSRTYPIYSIEDGLSEDDWDGWQLMMKKLGDRLQLVGDDLFVTNPARIAEGIEQHLANAVLIKPTQIGTITETLQAVLLCKDAGISTIVSHRSGETEDTFIVDLAVGTSSGQIKIGGCSRGERMTKYNQMLRIEDGLHLALLNE